MIDYINSMVGSFTTRLDINDISNDPETRYFFAFDERKKLSKYKAEKLNTIIAKGLFDCKIARPDLHPTISPLCMHIKNPNLDNWKKLMRLL